MQTKHLTGLIHIVNKGVVGTTKTCIGTLIMFLLTVLKWCFFCGFFFVICVSCLFLSYCLVCSLQPYGHLLLNG